MFRKNSKTIFLLILLYRICFPELITSQIFSPDKYVDTSSVGLISQDWPNIAVSKNGTVGITWVEHLTGDQYPVQFIKYSVEKDSFYGKVTVNNDPLPYFEDTRCNTKVIFDSSGHPIVCWHYNSYLGLQRFMMIARSYDFGNTFTEPYIFQYTDDFDPSLIVTKSNDFLVCWITQDLSAIGEQFIKFIRLPNCGTVISDSTTVYSFSQLGLEIEGQSLNLDNQGNIYVFWNPPPPNRLIYISKSNDNGFSFENPYPAYPDTLPQFEIKTVRKSEIIFVSYMSSSAIYRKVFFSELINNLLVPPKEVVYSTLIAFDYEFSFQESSGFIIVHYDTNKLKLKRDASGLGIFQDSTYISPGARFRIAQDRFGNIFLVSIFNNKVKLNNGNMLLTKISNKPVKEQINVNWSIQPNPFNSTINIKFQIPNSGRISIDLYNIISQKVGTLLDKFLTKGQYSFQWNISNIVNKNVSSGIYFISFNTTHTHNTKKIIYLK